MVRGQEAQGDSVLGVTRHEILGSLLSLYAPAQFTALSPGRHFFLSVSNFTDFRSHFAVLSETLSALAHVLFVEH